MAAIPPKLDNFPGSPYAEQLRRGFGRLRFSTPELEAGFARFHLNLVIGRVRVWQTIMLVLTIGIFVMRVREADGHWGMDLMVRLLVLVPCSVLLAAAALSPRYERWYPLALRWAAPVMYVLSMVMVGASTNMVGKAGLVVPTMALLAATLLIGALFFQALVMSALILGSYLAATAMFPETGQPPAYQAAVLLVVWVIGCVLAYGVEKSYRVAFLHNGLLGELVTQDGLTALRNRRAFDEHLTGSWQQALRDRRTLGVLMLDVDHFKLYNDRYGHQAGDEALRQVAAVVRQHSRRPLDLAARYGGEEFAVILFDLSDAAMADIAERIRAGVEQLGMPHADAPSGKVTVSVGVAVVRPTLERSPAGAVQLADEALYLAKREGRNRVQILLHEHSDLKTGQFHRRHAG